MSLKVSLLTIWLLLTTLASGQSWAEFHTALDSLDYQRAERMARQLPEGPQRELALAELAVTSDLPHRSFPLLDHLDPMALSPEVQATYYLVPAYQEEVTRYSSTAEKDQAVERMLKEGLRPPGSTRDRAQLLLFRLRKAWRGEAELARRTVAELQALEGVDPQLASVGQAILAGYEGRDQEAANLWSLLAENTELRGQPTAALAYRATALRHRLGRQPNASAEAGLLMDRALANRDAVAAGEVWDQLIHRIPQAQRGHLVEAVRSRLSRLPDNEAKLLLLQRLIFLGAEPMRTEVSRAAYQVAAKLDDPLLRAQFTDHLLYSLRDTPQADELSQELDRLLEGLDTRGLLGVGFQNSLLKDRRDPQPTPVLDPSDLPRALAAANGPRERVTRVLVDYLEQGLETGNAELAARTFRQTLMESLALSASDRGTALNAAINATLTTWPYRGASYENFQGSLEEALIAALGESLRRDPDLAGHLMNAQLEGLRGPQVSSLSARMMAGWLTMQSRHAEAVDVLSTARNALLNEREQAHLLADIGGVRKLAGEREEGYRLIRQGLVGAASVGATWHFSLLGWEALRTGHWEEAELWSGQAVAVKAEDGGEDLLRRQAFQLRALALESVGRPEDGLQALEQGQSVAAAQKPPWELAGYPVIRADLLLSAGRLEEARNALESAPMGEIALANLYELGVRRRVAAASGDTGEQEELENRVQQYLRRPESLPDDPVFAHHLARALGAPAPPLPPRKAAESYALVAQGLERMRLREPTNSALAGLSLADLKRLSRGCQSDELFLQPVLLNRSLVFLMLTRDSVELLEVYRDPDLFEKALSELHRTVSSPQSRLDSGDGSWTYLSRLLIQPWRERFPHARRVRWLAAGPLAKLPLSALPDGQGRLLRESAALMELDGPAIHDLRLSRDTRALLIGGASDLSGANAELALVRALFPKGELWKLGEDFARLKAEVSRSRLVHVSTHGAVPDGKSASGALRGDGHSLTAYELSELVFPPHTLAVVAACESFVDAGTGRDNTSLVSAFRAAGADVVIGSAWELDDEVTTFVIQALYRHIQAGEPVDVALSAAQAETARRWPHPYYWAGFQAVSGP